MWLLSYSRGCLWSACGDEWMDAEQNVHCLKVASFSSFSTTTNIMEKKDFEYCAIVKVMRSSSHQRLDQTDQGSIIEKITKRRRKRRATIARKGPETQWKRYSSCRQLTFLSYESRRRTWLYYCIDLTQGINIDRPRLERDSTHLSGEQENRWCD